MKLEHKGLIYVILSAMGFGLMPTFALFAYGSGITVEMLLFLRFLISGVLLFAYLIQKKTNLRLQKVEMFYLFLLGGVFYSATSILYFYSIKYIPASLAVLLMYTHPMMVALLAIVFNKEGLTRKMILAMSLSFAGLILILGDTVSQISGLGVILALASAVAYSIYIFVSSRVIKTISPMMATAYISIFASIGMLGLGLSQKNLHFNFDLTVGPPLLALVFISTILSILFFLRGVEILGPTKSSIISMFEPVFGVIFSILLFSEKMTLIQLVGGVAVLGGAALVVMSKEAKGVKVEESIEDTKKCCSQ